MTSIPAEIYALANAFLFALHNMLTKKALRYSNPATAVISVERVTSRIVTSAAMIVLGVMLLTFWK